MALKSRFFGYDKKEVERYVDQLKKLHETDCKKLETELSDLQKENELLKKQIEELTHRSQKIKDADILQLSLDKLESFNEYLKRYQEEEYYNTYSDELLAKEKLKEAINKIEESIEETKNNIKKELEHINKIIKSTNFSVVPGLSNSKTGTREGKDPAKNDNEESGIKLIDKPITADGTPLFDEWDETKENLDKRKKAKEEDKTASILQLSSFWGKIEEEDPPKKSDLKKEEKSDLVIEEPNGIDDLRERDHFTEEIAAAYLEKSEEESYDWDHAPEEENDLKIKINMVRYKYVLGKLAGEDLVDDSGNIIIKKHGVITEDVIEAAERENKLPELIINMVVQGMDE